MTVTTHLAQSNVQAVCGLIFPLKLNCVVAPRAGSRVGVTLGRTFQSCYTVTRPDSDSNARCGRCFP